MKTLWKKNYRHWTNKNNGNDSDENERFIEQKISNVNDETAIIKLVWEINGDDDQKKIERKGEDDKHD